MNSLKKWVKWLWPLLLVLLLVFALSRLDVHSVLYSVRQIPLWTVYLLVGLQIVSQLLVNFQWYLISKRFGTNITFGEMLTINCRGNVVDSVTPGVKIGGEVTRAVQIKKISNVSGTQAAAIVAVQKMFSVSALCTVALLTLWALIEGNLTLLAFILPIVFLVFVVIDYIIVRPGRVSASLQKKAPSKRAWLNKLRAFLITCTEFLSSLSGKASLSLLLLSVLIWTLYPAKLFILTTQLAPDVGLYLVGAIAFASYIVAMLPIFPGGLGGFEATMTGLLVTVGLVVSDAAVITVLFRFLTFWLVMLLSLAYIGCVVIWKKRKL